MVDEERTNHDGTPTLGTLVFWAGQEAECDGAISFDQLQVMRELAALLNENKIDDVEALRNLIGIRLK